MRHLAVLRPAAPALAGLALLAGGLAQAIPAHADFHWCWDDPSITVGSQTFTVQVGVQTNAQTSAAQVQADIQMANIVVHLPQGVTNYTVGAIPQTPFPQQVKVVSDNGSYTPGHGMHVKVVTTFTLKPGTPSLNAQLLLTDAKGSTSVATATVQGSMSRDINLPL
jgi:hypothetical protein